VTSPARTANLHEPSSAVATAAGVATVSLGPSDRRGGTTWSIDSLIWQTNRPGVAPVPRVQIYQDHADPSGSLVLSYDGSFGQAVGDLEISTGSTIIAVWTGAQAGDICTLTITGKRW